MWQARLSKGIHVSHVKETGAVENVKHSKDRLDQ
jgi:hypothetical protein